MLCFLKFFKDVAPLSSGLHCFQQEVILAQGMPRRHSYLCSSTSNVFSLWLVLRMFSLLVFLSILLMICLVGFFMCLFLGGWYASSVWRFMVFIIFETFHPFFKYCFCPYFLFFLSFRDSVTFTLDSYSCSAAHSS